MLEKAGFDCTAVKEKGRKLILPIGNGEIEVVLAKAADVITYVEYGVCDLGVVGKDTILENGTSFFEIMDLGFGKCKFALAAKKGTDFFAGHHAKTIALLGLSDGIVDIVETGTTLKENGLEVIENIVNISARLIANTASLKLRKKEIEELADKMEKAKE